MKRFTISLLIVITVAVTLLGAMAYEEDMNTIDHQITITTKNDYISVDEVLTIQGDSNESYENLTVWIQNDAKNINILVDSREPDSINQNGSEYNCNISNFGIKKKDSTEVKISYQLNKDAEFSKKVMRSTNSLKVTFDQKEKFTGADMAPGTSIILQLYQPTELTLDWYIIIFIILIVILIVVITLSTLRKQKSAKIKEIASGSEELLTTKKALLLSLLKEVEKQHRAKQISDDTYHKLKERYKQEAVEAMKQLDDMKSKI